MADPGATGVLEKLQGLTRFPALVRVVLPGLAAAAIAYPFIGARLVPPRAVRERLAEWTDVVMFLALAVLLGVVVSVVLGGKIYELYEGRWGWPRSIRDWARTWHQSRIGRLRDAADREKHDPEEFKEIWLKIRDYPLRPNGAPYASHPTLLGNIPGGYESYPATRYGMDGVFYWPRLWLQLDKDKRDSIDADWAIADGLLSLSAIGYVGGLLWLAAGLVHAAVSVIPSWARQDWPWAVALGTALLVAGYVAYALSLPFHRQNGDLFKAVFDLYRPQVSVMRCVTVEESAAWEGAWQYLQYLLVRCQNCGRYYSAGIDRCEVCGFARSESLAALGRQFRVDSESAPTGESGQHHRADGDSATAD